MSGGKLQWLLSWMGKGSLLKRICRVQQQHYPADNAGGPETVNLGSVEDNLTFHPHQLAVSNNPQFHYRHSAVFLYSHH